MLHSGDDRDVEHSAGQLEGYYPDGYAMGIDYLLHIGVAASFMSVAVGVCDRVAFASDLQLGNLLLCNYYRSDIYGRKH